MYEADIRDIRKAIINIGQQPIQAQAGVGRGRAIESSSAFNARLDAWSKEHKQLHAKLAKAQKEYKMIKGYDY